MTRAEVLDFILAELTRMKAESMVAEGAEIGPDTVLIGSRGVVDSQSLVNLLLALEDHIEAAHGRSFDWNNDKALSATRSPFRTPGALAEFALEASS
jgi:hypothetical protein